MAAGCWPRVKILSVEDHELFRDGLRVALQNLAAPGTNRDAAAPELIEAHTGQQALEMLERDSDVGLVLIDLTLPDWNGLELLRIVRARFPTVAAVVVSASERAADARAALDAGAAGFVPKRSGRAVLVSAIQLVLAGGVYVPPLLLEAPSDGAPSLSPRQLEVAELLVKGLTNKEIANVLGMATGTAKTHVAAILETLGVANRTEAVLALVERGLVAAPGPGRS
jgi:DNA-binding NarL/FixJ family response regulator